MTEQDKQQLNLEISHIFDSGANHLRVFEMVELFIDSRTPVNTSGVLGSVSGTCYLCHNVNGEDAVVLGDNIAEVFDKLDDIVPDNEDVSITPKTYTYYR